MIQLLERFLLFFCCGLFYLLHMSDLQAPIFSMLIVIILSSFCGYLEKRTLRIGILILYALLCMVHCEYLFFLPLLAYDFFLNGFDFYQLLFIIPLLYNMDKIQPEWSILVAYYLIAVLFKLTHSKLQQLTIDFHFLQDETAEINRQLHIKNQELIETQDVEIKAATLDERNRIAREIHDSVGHQLSSSILQTGALLAVTQDELTRERLTDLKDTLTLSMDSIRHSIHNIIEDSLDLEEKIKGLINNFRFCPVCLEYQIENDFPIKVKYSLLFIIKESLTNIMKHSNATSGLIAIYEHPAFYQIRIHDNGTRKASHTGLRNMPGNPERKTDSEGSGLAGMSERIEALGGKLNISRENGFEIFITLPKASEWS